MLNDNSSEREQGPFRGTFYVFVHGLIGIHVPGNQGAGDGHIELLIPDVGPNHAYRFGEFLGEITLPPSAAPYRIIGIDGGNYRFSADQHLVTSTPVPVCGSSKLYARIRLPIPIAVHSYLEVDLTNVVHDPNRQLAGRKGTMVPVLEYSFQDPRKILFGCEPLNVAPLRYGNRWYMNLHIFAEEDLERPEDHTVAGFDAIAALFDFAGAPQIISTANVPVPTRKHLPPGTSPLEFTSLALRTREIGYLGRMIREESLQNGPLLVHLTPVGSDPVTCLPLVSQ